MFKLKNFSFIAKTTSCLFLCSQVQRPQIWCQNYDIENLKQRIQKQVSNIKYKFSTQANYFPNVVVKQIGNTYYIEFIVDQRNCDIFSLFHNVIEFFSKNSDFQIDGQNIRSFSAQEIKTLQIDFKEGPFKGTISIMGEFILDRPGFKFTIEKNQKITDNDIQLLMQVYEEAYKPSNMREVRKKYINQLQQNPNQQKQQQSFFFGKSHSTQDIKKKVEELEEMGIQVIQPDSNQLNSKEWNELGGYESQKRAIEDTILLSLTHQEIYDEITKKTRQKWERNKPKAILFEGPPGTGKTTSAKIIASQVGIPLIYVPIEAVLSKWYGKAEQNLSTVFENASAMGKSIVFIDEIDALAVSRNEKETHEVSKRLVSILLRKLDSFESENEVILICATNRKDFLDPAMLSRLDLSIKFDLPDLSSRKEIFKRYAKQFNDDKLMQLAQQSNGFSGRAILEVCKDVERKWASKYIRNEVQSYEPEFDEYIESIKIREHSNLY